MITLPPALLGFLDALLTREWLVTNGAGAYASGTVAGVNTRRYHGLLVAALDPPVRRTLLVAKVDEAIEVDGRRTDLGTNEYGDGTIAPQGYRTLVGFRLDGLIPVWTFAVPGATLEKMVWMARERNGTYVRYRLLAGSRPARLLIQPYLTERDYHGTARGDPGRRFIVTPVHGGIRAAAREGAVPCALLASRGSFVPVETWHWNFLHRAERARGLDCVEDLFVPGRFEAALGPGEEMTVLATAEPDDPQPPDGAAAFLEERARQDLLIRKAAHLPADPIPIPEEGGLPRRLALAADQFLVRGGGRWTVIAGYHWFTDWGRDTMIALPGLALATGRPAEAREILLSFAGSLSEGMLPNRFPDRGGPPEYTSVDAALWYVHAVHRYLERVEDPALLERVSPALREIIDRYRAGTRHGIRVDADGLLEAGAPELALTWMDARVDGRAITPRAGKAVELNALWYNALRCVARWMGALGRDAAALEAEAAKMRAAFLDRFSYPAGGYLYDLIAPDGTPDPALRPNQLLALSLPYPLVVGPRAQTILDAVSARLLTLFGLRSLAPTDPGYRGTYGGGLVERDEAYHQGTVWPWWLGPYVAAVVRLTGDRAAARRLLAPFRGHLLEAGLGSVNEIFGGDPPHDPAGCIAQAWSVGALLEAWEIVGGGDG